MRLTIAIVGGLVMIGVLALSAASQATDNMIVPGQRIGPYRLGMTLAEMIGLLGSTGERSLTTMPQSYGMLWRNKWIRFSFFNTTHTVSAVTLCDSDENRQYRTAEGIGLGSDASELDRFGRPEWRHQYQDGTEAHAYWKFSLYTQTKDGKVTAIGVFDNQVR